MSLSTGQLLLLNALMYMTEDPLPRIMHHKGKTIRELLRHADPKCIEPHKEYDCFISGGEWLRILGALQREPAVLNMRIAFTHEDRGPGGGGGQSAVFLGDREAVVVFKGTQSPEEWADNFAGVNLADTPHQRNALTWFRRICDTLRGRYSITVTGHSKGGNKAKYVTVLDDGAARCVAFDGQGFSDLFMSKYAHRISHRQRIIENHSAEYDFVNFLFHNVGNEQFYIASPLENAGFARNHSPSAMMHFTPEGDVQMIPAPGGQAEGMAALRQFCDCFFASLTPTQRETSYRTVEALRSAAFSMDQSRGILNTFLPLLSDPDHTDDLAYLLAFTIAYERQHPPFIEKLRRMLAHFGLEDITKYILLADGILNLQLDTPLGTLTFDGLLDELSRGTQGISPGLLAIIIGWAASRGISITPPQLRQLLAVLPRVNDYLRTIPVSQWWEPPAPSSGLGRLSQSLERLGTLMGGGASGDPGDAPPSRLRNVGSRLRTIGHVTGQISDLLQQATQEDPDIIDV